MGELSASDRSFLDNNFQRYGSAWSGGLTAIDEHFLLRAESKWRKYVLYLTLRAPPRLSYTIEIKKNDGGMSTRGPDLPDEPELSTKDREQVDTILRALGELWLIEPSNHHVCILDVTSGITALQGDLDTRRLEHRAVLYLDRDKGFSERFCLWFDLDANALEGLSWVEMPLRDGGRWLTREEVDFLERATRENGDFGVYGNVQDGLRSLVEQMEVSMSEEGDNYQISAYPRDGHGHFLHFPIHRVTGEIADCAAGHLEPEPDLELGLEDLEEED